MDTIPSARIENQRMQRLPAQISILDVKSQRRRIKRKLNQIRHLSVLQSDGSQFQGTADRCHKIRRHDNILESTQEICDSEYSGHA